MLQNAVVLYRSTITFSYVVSTNQSRLRIPTGLLAPVADDVFTLPANTALSVLSVKSQLTQEHAAAVTSHPSANDPV